MGDFELKNKFNKLKFSINRACDLFKIYIDINREKVESLPSVIHYTQFLYPSIYLVISEEESVIRQNLQPRSN